MKKVLTIAGSDCSGGAGIQADLKTFTAHKVYGMSIITALTAQNTTGVYGIFNTPAEFVKQQMDCVFSDIFPDAVKIGMVSVEETIDTIVDMLNKYSPKNIVIDPVMISTSGSLLLDKNAVNCLVKKLLPFANIITPNIPEAEALSNIKILSSDDMIKAGQIIHNQIKTAVLIKGGHLENTADDMLIYESNIYWFKAEKINNPNTHGTGCTLSSAIASNLANGYNIYTSVKLAKEYVTKAIKSNLNLGKGNGPLNHCIF